ncbi:hypothetical protein PPL_01358 [Heterostelium album PN500]|uniref:Uncharacterized protein n=1 Tax=Heterostelium pallidum (strain ATCC 26659 / Pp 5 / PN500) TaxID=670386 RepID=D3AZ18_HETP5|nr:hypothetical protein PPL_01358 [Heterostelium album PN500]EFA85575.1 hypothetical protein PPL_01358 [Heterostelium album PN500]|eukprot:XP_020437682.1 hypothetical protein PPL_01358 [Heterostelium album PN500]
MSNKVTCADCNKEFYNSKFNQHCCTVLSEMYRELKEIKDEVLVRPSWLNMNKNSNNNNNNNSNSNSNSNSEVGSRDPMIIENVIDDITMEDYNNDGMIMNSNDDPLESLPTLQIEPCDKKKKNKSKPTNSTTIENNDFTGLAQCVIQKTPAININSQYKNNNEHFHFKLIDYRSIFNINDRPHLYGIKDPYSLTFKCSKLVDAYLYKGLSRETVMSLARDLLNIDVDFDQILEKVELTYSLNIKNTAIEAQRFLVSLETNNFKFNKNGSEVDISTIVPFDRKTPDTIKSSNDLALKLTYLVVNFEQILQMINSSDLKSKSDIDFLQLLVYVHQIKFQDYHSKNLMKVQFYLI